MVVSVGVLGYRGFGRPRPGCWASVFLPRAKVRKIKGRMFGVIPPAWEFSSMGRQTLRFWRRQHLVLVIGLAAWWAMALLGTALSAAPAPVRAPEGKAAEAAATLRNVFARPSRELTQKLHMARQLLAERRYAEAVGLLNTLLEAEEDYFLLDGSSGGVRGLRAEAQRLLGAMPREGRELYELRYGARARQMLAEAAASGNAQALAEVSRRFFHTQAGYEATLLLGLYYLDHGSPLAGALTLQRLGQIPEVAEQFEPGLSVLLATCWSRAGASGKAREALEAVRVRQGRASLRIAGVEVPLEAMFSRLAGAASEGQPALPASQEWLSAGGNAAHNAAASGEGPLLSLTWRVPTTESPRVEKTVLEISRAFRQRDQWAVPALRPLVVGDKVLMRTVRNLLAVDFVTGKRVWEVPTDDPIESLTNGVADSPFQPPQVDVRFGLRLRLWGDATYGALSSDGQFVFAVEDLTLDVTPFRQGFPFAQRDPRTEARTYNRLAAFDVKTGKLVWHVGGTPDEWPLPLAGMFFLGPPLPLAGQVYVLAETKGEIRLLALEARSGALQWSQQLAVVDQERDLPFDPLRRLAGLSPSYADGVLVCPTANHAVVALDLASRSLLWGFAYGEEEQESGFMGPFQAPRGLVMEIDPAARWADSCAILAEGKVLITPADSDWLYCLDLLTGKLCWKAPREDNLYLACVVDGKAILVGRRGMRAYYLQPVPRQPEGPEEGGTPEPAWEGRTLEYPGGALPSGIGFLSGGHYYVPLSSGDVLAVDVKAGAVARTYRSRRGAVPGNLVACRGRILSQKADSLEAFYQLDALRAAVAQRLKSQPEDPEVLALHGEILWDEGKLDEALDVLRKAYRGNPLPNYRNLLREAWFDALKTRFATYRAQATEVESLLDAPEHQKTFLRLFVTGLMSAGEHGAALKQLQKLMEWDNHGRQMERVDAGHQVRSDRWVQTALAQLRQAAGAEVQAEIDRLAGQALEAAIQAGSTEALQRFLDYYGGLPLADQARWHLVQKLRIAARYLPAELLLRRLGRSSDRRQSARAAAELASLLREANLPEHAAIAYRFLAERFGDVVLADGKTGRQVLETLPAEDPIRKSLRLAEPWPRGRVVIGKERPRGPLPPPLSTAVVPLPEGGGAFYRDAMFELQSSTQSVQARNGWGLPIWQWPVGDLFRQGRFSIHSGAMRGAVLDHLVVLSLGSRVVALDTLTVGRSGVPATLWSTDLEQSSPLPGAMARLRGRRVMAIYQQPRLDAPLLPATIISEQLVCYQRFHELHGVDPVTGQTLWIREDTRAESSVFGDDQYVIVLPPDENVAMVLRAADGSLLGTRVIPEGRLGTVGRYVVAWQPGLSGGGQQGELSVLDPWTGQPLWPPRRFAENAKAALLGKEAVGVLETQGRFVLLRLADGQTVVDTPVLPEPSLAEMFLFEWPGGYVLVANSLERPESKPLQIYGMHGIPSAHIHRARVYGFDRNGKKLWQEPAVVTDQFLLTHQPARLPALIFACGTLQRRGVSLGQQRVVWVAVDKRTGQTIRPKEFSDWSTNLRLSGDAEQKVIRIELQKESITLEFTALPPEPPPSKEKVSPIKGLLRSIIPHL